MNYQVIITDEEVQGCFLALARRNVQILVGVKIHKTSEFAPISKVHNITSDSFILLTFFTENEIRAKKFFIQAQMKEVYPDLFVYGNGV